MAPMQFENKITMGNALTMVGMVAGAIWGYSQFRADLTVQTDRLVSVEQIIRDHGALDDADRAGKDIRIRSLETQAAGFGADLRNIQAGVTRIENAVNDLNKKVGP